jgi:hypothetical protein
MERNHIHACFSSHHSPLLLTEKPRAVHQSSQLQLKLFELRTALKDKCIGTMESPLTELLNSGDQCMLSSSSACYPYETNLNMGL